MLVKEWMNEDVVPADVDDTVHRAVVLMMDHNVGILPVTEEGRLVGVLTDEDLKRVAPPDTNLPDIPQVLYLLSSLHVRAIVNRDPVTVSTDFTIEEAAAVLLNRKISGCPVVDRDGRFVGLVTKDDLLRAMVSLSGLLRKGIQFGFLVDDRPGTTREITEIMRRFNARFVSVMSSYENASQGSRYLFVRAFNIDRERLPELKSELMKRSRIIYMVDHRENRREIFNDR